MLNHEPLKSWIGKSDGKFEWTYPKKLKFNNETYYLGDMVDVTYKKPGFDEPRRLGEVELREIIRMSDEITQIDFIAHVLGHSYIPILESQITKMRKVT